MQVNLVWSLYQEETANTIERHCSTCGRTITFTNIGKIRRNANGKNIFEYAIYRCEKGHTWNRKLSQYKAHEHSRHAQCRDNTPGDDCQYVPTETIETLKLSQYQKDGLKTILVRFDVVKGSWRLDKLLSTYIDDVNRTEIRKMIAAGQILLNNRETKAGSLVKGEGIIQININ